MLSHLYRRRRKSCGTTVVSKQAAEPLPADSLRTSGLRHTLSWEQKHISFPLMRPFGVKVRHELCKCALQRAFAEKDQLRQAFLFAERTQRSANAFRFGLRAGSFRGLTPAAVRIDSKEAQNLVSRSCST